MQKFPRFLKQNPTFFGFELTDLFLLLMLFQIGSLLGIEPLVALIASFGVVLLIRFLLKSVDLVGLFLGGRNKTLSWMDELKEKGL